MCDLRGTVRAYCGSLAPQIGAQRIATVDWGLASKIWARNRPLGCRRQPPQRPEGRTQPKWPVGDLGSRPDPKNDAQRIAFVDWGLASKIGPKLHPCKKQFCAQLSAPFVDLGGVLAPQNRSPTDHAADWGLALKNDPEIASLFNFSPPLRAWGYARKLPSSAGKAKIRVRGDFGVGF